MKVHATSKPCKPFVSTLEDLVFDQAKGGLFRWYVRKHAEKCGGCRATLDALKCYQDAVRLAYEEAKKEGEDVMTLDDVSDLLNRMAETS